MKRILILSGQLIMLFASGAAVACDQPEALGHHWEVPAYLHEIYFQVAAMALITIVIAGFSALKRTKRKRGLGQ